jgi:predicted nucleic acid-binding protein
VIVVDASALLEVLLRTSRAPVVESVLFAPGTTLHAPHLVDVEVAQVLRRYARAGQIVPERGAEAVADVADLPLTRYPIHLLLPRVWELRDSLTAYDAVYVALAEALEAPLVTCDQRMAHAPGHRARVVVV